MGPGQYLTHQTWLYKYRSVLWTLYSVMIKKLNLFWLGSPLGTPVDINVDITKYFHQIRIFRFNLYYLAKIYVSTIFGKPYLMTYRFLDNALTHCAMLIGSNLWNWMCPIPPQIFAYWYASIYILYTHVCRGHFYPWSFLLLEFGGTESESVQWVRSAWCPGVHGLLPGWSTRGLSLTAAAVVNTLPQFKLKYVMDFSVP